MTNHHSAILGIEAELQRIKSRLPKRLDLMVLTGETQGLREALNQLYDAVHGLIDLVYDLEGQLRDESPDAGEQPRIRVMNG